MKRNIVAAVLALSVMLPTAAIARDHRHSPSPQSTGEHAGSATMHGMMSGMCPRTMAKRTEGSLAFLKAELAIATSQAREWNAFAKVYRETGAGMPQRGGGMMRNDSGDHAAQTLPQHIAKHIKMMEDHLHNLERLQAPIEDLYATLDEHQKHTANELMPMLVMCRMM
jgi:hypothetical protein